MAPVVIIAVPFAASGELFSTQTLGEAVLISIGAFVVGFIVSWLWPKQQKPELFGFLSSLLLVAGLAYLGNAGAGLALLIVLGLGALLMFSGVVG